MTAFLVAGLASSALVLSVCTLVRAMQTDQPFLSVASCAIMVGTFMMATFYTYMKITYLFTVVARKVLRDGSITTPTESTRHQTPP